MNSKLANGSKRYWNGYRAMKRLHYTYGEKAWGMFNECYGGCSDTFYRGAKRYYRHVKGYADKRIK